MSSADATSTDEASGFGFGHPTPLRHAASRGVPIAVFAVLVWIVPVYLSYHSRSIATTWLIFAMLVYGVDLLNASVRYLSLAHVAIWSTAAYSVLILQVHGHFGFWSSVGISTAICLGLGLAIASFSFRTSGYYFALLTFVIAQLINLVYTNDFRGLTGGPVGIFLFERPHLFGVDTSQAVPFLRIVGFAVVVVILFVILVRTSRLGRLAAAIGQENDLAEALAIPTYRVKVIMFVLSIVPAIVAGILYALQQGAITPDLFGPQVAFAVVLVAILGGSGTLAGPLLGAAVYVFAPEVLPFDPTVDYGAVGLLLILIIRFAPSGLSVGLASIGRYSLDFARGMLRPRSAHE
jgi:branched-chain amino acid transport system permease protein